MTPCSDLNVALKNSVAASSIRDSNTCAWEVDVVKQECTTGFWLGICAIRSGDANLGVADYTVHDNGRADSFIDRVCGRHVQTDLTVLNVERLECPQPVPLERDSSIATVEREISGCELLTTKEGTDVATLEGDVSHEHARTVLHHNASLFASGSGRLHVKENILHTACLRNLPVNTIDIFAIGTSFWHLSHIDDKVSDLTIEVVLVCVPILAIAIGNVWISVKKSQVTSEVEVGRALNSGWVCGVTDHLSVIPHDDRAADLVGTSREVDDCRCDG